MKLHHLLAVLCVVLLICFGTLLVVHYKQSADIVDLENQLSTITAERDQLVAEAENLSKSLESQKIVFEEELNIVQSRLTYFQQQYNELYDKTTPDHEPKSMVENAFENADTPVGTVPKEIVERGMSRLEKEALKEREQQKALEP